MSAAPDESEGDDQLSLKALQDNVRVAEVRRAYRTKMSLEQTPNESLGYYKTQYEQLEAELADFQASSRELESELERDIEASEKRERQLQEKVDNLGYEVNEWKVSVEH